jgi:hypothetical protein
MKWAMGIWSSAISACIQILAADGSWRKSEIPLLVTPEASPLPTLDSTRLLASAAFDVAVGAQPMPTRRGRRAPA